jgi:protein SCO1
MALSLELSLKSKNSSTESIPDPLIIPPDHPRHLINFSLVDQNGREVTRQSFKNKIVVVNFLFTSCSVVCPYVTDQMAQIQQQTAQEKDVLLLSLTVDPADDTVAVLSKYAQKAGADPSRWFFVTGNEAVMQNLIGTSFLPHDTDTNFASMPGNFANSQRIVLVDTNGQIVKYFDGLNLDAAHAVVQEIKKLRKSAP